MKRTPLVPRGAIFKRRRMIELVEVDWPVADKIKNEVAIYDSIQGIAGIWHHPSARFVRLQPGDAVVYTDENGIGRRYMQR